MRRLKCRGNQKMQYVLYKDLNGQWRWYLEAANGRKIANSGEGYHNRADAIAAVYLVMDTNRNTKFVER
jgi:uncharacterized protein YegP (UPF0339 family)